MLLNPEPENRHMKKSRLLAAGLAMFAAASTMASEARASTYSFVFGGMGIGGTLVLTYGAATDAKYPNAYEVTGIRGSFYDTNNGLNIVGAPVGSLMAITHATPEPGNTAAPNDFSRFAVMTGLPDYTNGFATYDNLFWPGGSPQTGSDYPFQGGFLDVYGLLFDVGGGRMVNVWSNGDMGDGVDYGASLTTADAALDYVAGGVAVSATPEPGSLALIGVGSVGLVGVLRRRRRNAAAA